jgi:hypothetical protein
MLAQKWESFEVVSLTLRYFFERKVIVEVKFDQTL